jgi:PAS domain S-box-containing protein
MAISPVSMHRGLSIAVTAALLVLTVTNGIIAAARHVDPAAHTYLLVAESPESSLPGTDNEDFLNNTLPAADLNDVLSISRGTLQSGIASIVLLVAVVVLLLAHVSYRRRTENALRRSNAELEKKVEERTSRLEALNESLSQEVEERRKAEESLRHRTATLRSILDVAPIGIGLAKNRVLEWTNEALSTMTGYSAEELHGMYAREVYPTDEEFERVGTDQYGEIAKHGRGTIETRFRRKNGTLVDVWLSSAAVSPGDLSAGVVFTAMDVTERKQATEALKSSEERFRSLFELAPDAILAAEAEDDRIVDANPAAEELFLRPCDRIVGMKLPELLSTDASGNGVVGTDPSGQSESVRRSEAAAVQPNGHHVPVELVRKSLDVDGRHLVIGILRDISERKKADELLRQTDRHRAVADLAAGVAHNFNNLLQIVVGNTNLALLHLKSSDYSAVEHCLEEVLESSGYASETVKRLNTFAQMRNSDAGTLSDVFDLAEIARLAIDMSVPWWKHEPQKRGVTVEVHQTLTKGCFVSGRKNELFEVIVNLIKNASEALTDGGRIHVNCTSDLNVVTLEVRDTGIGIPEEDINRLFTPFFTTKKGTGTGLGLAVSRSIVESHGGYIRLASVVDLGTTVSISFPAVKPALSQDREPKRVPPVDSPLSVLVIDDLEPVARMLKGVLTEHGHTVCTALSGREGLKLWEEHNPDAVICDLAMPEMNGRQVAHAIKERCRIEERPRPHFIMITGWSDQVRDRELTDLEGVDCVAEKPMNISDLLECLRKAARSASVQTSN